MEILVSIEESRHILTRYKSLAVPYPLEDIVDMLGVQLRKEIIEQENRLFFTHSLDEFNLKEFESEENGLILSSGKIFVCAEDLIIACMYLECEIVEMRSYIGMSRDDVPFSFLSEVFPDAPRYIREIHFCYIFESDLIFPFKQAFYRAYMLADKIEEFQTIDIIFLRFLDKEIVPDIKRIARCTSLSNLFENRIAIPEDFLIIPLDRQEIRICEQHRLVEEIPSK